MILDPITPDEIRAMALSLGWDDVGLTSPIIPEEDILAYRQWIDSQYHGNLEYMEKQIRCYPEELLPGAKTAIIFVTYYKQPRFPFKENEGLVASYARGRDYHHVHRKRLKKFIKWLEERAKQTGIAKGFSDSTPILEKALAVQAGLGWFGKNTLLIHRKFGTFTLLSGILTTLQIETSPTFLRLPRCGTCTRCLDACPTQAFVSPYLLDATKCLSYHLIESKNEIPPEIKDKNPGYVFGCDICQDACPHNQRKQDSSVAEFSPNMGLGVYLDQEKIEKIEQQPESLFGTPLQRKGAMGLKLNFSNLKKNS